MLFRPYFIVVDASEVPQRFKTYQYNKRKWFAASSMCDTTIFDTKEDAQKTLELFPEEGLRVKKIKILSDG